MEYFVFNGLDDFIYLFISLAFFFFQSVKKIFSFVISSHFVNGYHIEEQGLIVIFLWGEKSFS